MIKLWDLTSVGTMFRSGKERMMQPSLSPAERTALFNHQLLKGEHLIWVDQPDQSIHLAKPDRFMIPASLLWEGFFAYALFHRISTGDFGSSIIDAFFLIIFNFIGVYLVVGRYFFKRWRKAQTYYALSNRRALVHTRFMGEQTDSVFLANVPITKTVLHANGSGDLKFGDPQWGEGLYANTGMDVMYGVQPSNAPTYFDVPNLHAVHQMAQDQLKEVIDPRHLTRTAR
ncbi:MAG: hypothetical protein ACREEE_14080 [Dongiaceae bacterium]